jgi:hypothetical protein
VEVQELVAGSGVSSVELVSDSLQGFGLFVGPTHFAGRHLATKQRKQKWQFILQTYKLAA